MPALYVQGENGQTERELCEGKGVLCTFYLSWVFTVRKDKSRTTGQEDIGLVEQMRGGMV